ncbi:MAG TPA: 30S ribosomal protein S12 methylthiotransferase RimO [Acidimicrobiales bacterium]|nr:30S ribosomal protein S12 methylthiotransferase RimO [Acidimicrobiales bacterium]
MAPRRYWVETLGCPKNSVDSDKVTGRLLADGYLPADAPDAADLVVVNTCAFVEEARQESIDTILGLSDARRDGAELVVTGCMAERYGDELAQALPEVDRVVGFGGPITGAPDEAAWVPVSIGSRPAVPALDLLNMPRPAATAPWAYLKVAEGCDRACGFCAIPSFRGQQRSRTVADVVAEAEALAASGVREIVLVAQDLASFGRDQGQGERSLVPLLGRLDGVVDRVRLLYLYPSELTDGLIDAICATGVPYFDLSLQHVSRPLVRRMRRWGDGERYLERIRAIREREPDAAFRSNFIVGYPGETEADHDALLAFVEEARLDWCGFFRYSEEDGTYAADLDGAVPDALVADRLFELRDLQDDITAARRDELVGRTVSVLVDEPGVGRSHREAPEIDGVVTVPAHLEVGSIADVVVVSAEGPEVHAVVAEVAVAGDRS